MSRNQPRHGAACAVCPVCASIEPDESSKPWLELADPSRRNTSAEAIADHLGFCARHAATLAGVRWPPGLGSALADGFGIVAAMLDDRQRYEERLLHIMFHARRTCAACNIERRRAAVDPAGHAGETGLCLPHYRAAAATADQAQLARLSAAAVRAARAWSRKLQDAERDDDCAAQGALRWLAGEAFEARAQDAQTSRAGACCPVCAAAARAQQKWLDSVSSAMDLGLELHALLPLCPAHIRLCASRSRRRDRREFARQATALIADRLARGLAENARAVQREREESSSVWYRRRAPSYVLGQRRRALRLPHCGACGQVDLACQRAQGEILDLVASRRGRDILARQADLCLRHFGGVYMLCPHGEPRAALAARQREALERAQIALTTGGGAGARAIASGLLGAPGAA